MSRFVARFVSNNLQQKSDELMSEQVFGFDGEFVVI